MNVERLTGMGGDDDLLDRWRALLKEGAYDTPFLSPEWFQGTLECYPDGADPFLLAVNDGAELAGVAPLQRSTGKIRGVPVRKLGFITNPDTPYSDFILKRGAEEEVLSALMGHLCGKAIKEWDVLEFREYPTDSPSLRALRAVLDRIGMRTTLSSCSRTPYVTIDGNWEDFLQGRSPRFRKTHRNIVNRIAKMNAEILCHRNEAEESLLEDILSVSRNGWKHGEGIAISSREETIRFFEFLTRIAGRNGWLMVWVLRIDGKPVAMEYDLEHKGVVYALRSDFDEVLKECSPGSFLEYRIAKHLFENGYKEYNTGPGMNTYKLHWTEQMKENVMLIVYNRTLPGMLAHAMEGRLVPFMKRFRDLNTRKT